MVGWFLDRQAVLCWTAGPSESLLHAYRLELSAKYIYIYLGKYKYKHLGDWRPIDSWKLLTNAKHIDGHNIKGTSSQPNT